MFCKKCGMQVNPGEYCSNCGALATGEGGSSPLGESGSSDYGYSGDSATDVYGQPLESDVKTVDKWVYIILTFVAGCLGVHKFYSGKTKIGILYIVLFCIFGLSFLFAFIDLLMALFKKADEEGNIEIDPHSFFL